MRSRSWACVSSRAACSASKSESTSIGTLSAMGMTLEGEPRVEDISNVDLERVDDFFYSSTLALYPPAPHFWIFVPNFTIHHDNFLEFQPLFRTPLLHTAPCQLPLGHPFLRISG